MNKKAVLTILTTAVALIALFAISCGGSARGPVGHNQGGGSASITVSGMLS